MLQNYGSEYQNWLTFQPWVEVFDPRDQSMVEVHTLTLSEIFFGDLVHNPRDYAVPRERDLFASDHCMIGLVKLGAKAQVVTVLSKYLSKINCALLGRGGMGANIPITWVDQCLATRIFIYPF